MLQAVRASGGSVAAVSDVELAAARAALSRHDGIDAEFSAVAGVALLMRAPEDIEEGTVCVITASGFKHTFAGDAPTAMPDADLAARVGAFLTDADPAAIILH